MTGHRDAIALLDAMIQQALEDYEEDGTPEALVRVVTDVGVLAGA